MSLPPGRKSAASAFTLVEMMVSVAILTMIVYVLVSITSQTTRTWRYTSGKVEEFREARTAFETVTSRLRQATLNTYWDYSYDSKGLPKSYERRSELRFICGSAEKLIGANGASDSSHRVTHAVFFHAPLGLVETTQPNSTSTTPSHHGLDNLLNVWGYFVEFNSDKPFRPPPVNSIDAQANSGGRVPERFRFRLMEFRQPSEKLSTYGFTSGIDSSNGLSASVNYHGWDWFLNGSQNVNSPGVTDASGKYTPPPSQPIAENIIALILVPRLSKQDELQLYGTSGDYSPLAPNYWYDSAPDPKSPGPTLAANLSNKNLDPMNQLPPVVQVTMVAIDDQSAVRMRLNPNGYDVFNMSSRFADTNKYGTDLKVTSGNSGNNNPSLEDTLIAQKATYRIFTSDVVIRAAKWSREQSN